MIEGSEVESTNAATKTSTNRIMHRDDGTGHDTGEKMIRTQREGESRGR